MAENAHDGITLAEVLARFGPSAGSVPLLVLGAASMVPSPGLPLGMVCGSLLMVMALAGLPAAAARIKVPAGLLRGAARRLAPLLARIEARLKPRYTLLAEPPRALLSLVIFAMGLLIALPIPFGNQLPGLALTVTALGLLSRDGVAVGAGMSLAAATAVGFAWVAALGINALN